MLDLLVIYSNPLTPGLALILLIWLLLLLVSALVSASEVAFFSLSPQHLLDLKNTASEKDKRILNLLKDSKRLEIKLLIKELEKKNKNVVYNIFKSSENVNIDTVLATKQNGEKKYFTENYDK